MGFAKVLLWVAMFGFLLFGRLVGGLLKIWCVFLSIAIWSIENLDV
jgi:hypothetical protein